MLLVCRFCQCAFLTALVQKTSWEFGAQVGKGNVLLEAKAGPGAVAHVALLGYGTIVNECLQAAEILRQQNVSVTVADMRFCKPLDVGLLKRLVKEHTIFVTVEENTVGGFASHGTPCPVFAVCQAQEARHAPKWFRLCMNN